MTTSLNLSDVDFDAIKANLKTFLKNQPQYKDVNFESPNIAVLIDVLAYNTYLNSFYQNMVAAESFMDSAQLRDSIISHAKELNYVPRSFRSAIALVNVTVETGNSSVQSILIPKASSFTTQVGSNTFTFSVANNIVATSTNGTFTATNVALYEGTYLTDTFVYDVATAEVVGDQQRQRFILSNQQIDTDSLEINVIEDGGATTLLYQRFDQLIDVKESTRAYFIQAVENNQYEIYFGTGIVGRRPKNGALIVANYRVGNGELCNGADTFTNDGAIDGYSNVTIVTTTSAEGGAIYETTESIRFNAPRYFQTQGRAITADDYKTILTVEFPEIDAINVFGGEELNPPMYGKVFISVKRNNATIVSEERKNIYKGFLKNKTALAIGPEFIDPEFLFVEAASTVNYNVASTIKNLEDIKTLVVAAITAFNSSEIDNFQVTLRYSKFIKAIDDADASILSNETDLRLYKLITPDTTQDFSIALDFNNVIRHDFVANTANGEHAIETGSFSFGGKTVQIEDDNAGALHLFEVVNNMHSLVQANIGTVDYDNGIVKIGPLRIDSFTGSGIKVYAALAAKDIVATKNSILTILDSDVNVTVVAENA